jgi:hypothetical protein
MSEKTLRALLQIRMHEIWALDTAKDMNSVAERLLRSVTGETAWKLD